MIRIIDDIKNNLTELVNVLRSVSVSGPQGVQGPTGNIGPQGPAGPASPHNLLTHTLSHADILALGSNGTFELVPNPGPNKLINMQQAYWMGNSNVSAPYTFTGSPSFRFWYGAIGSATPTNLMALTNFNQGNFRVIQQRSGLEDWWWPSDFMNKALVLGLAAGAITGGGHISNTWKIHVLYQIFDFT